MMKQLDAHMLDIDEKRGDNWKIFLNSALTCRHLVGQLCSRIDVLRWNDRLLESSSGGSSSSEEDEEQEECSEHEESDDSGSVSSTTAKVDTAECLNWVSITIHRT